ncbi:MAG: amino acid adenylation domain-containing protein [Bacteroidetes bacterium]|nr:amino acid adenylation domain-containing protein [Bacteroidota bacterium]
MSGINEFLEQLRKQQIAVYVEENTVKIKAPRELLTEEILGSIKERKQEILNYYEQREKSKPVPVTRAAEKEYYPLSYAQRRIYYLQSVSSASVLYNINYSVKIDGVVDTNKLQDVFRQLITRHESLRTSFVEVNHTVMQRIVEEVPFKMDMIACTTEELEGRIRQYTQPFRMEQPPLMRVGLFSLPGDQHLLRVELHHSIADGYSNMILLREFMKLYQGKKLSPLTLRYRDFSEWQQSPAMQEKIAAQRKFWLKEFAEMPSVTDLPSDYARPDKKSERGCNYFFTLDAYNTAQLKAIALKNRATLFTILLSAYAVMISRLSSLRDTVIGIPAAGRHQDELEEMIGMFVNTIPMRLQPYDEIQFGLFMETVQDRLLHALDNQDYPYDHLVTDLQLPYVPGRNPLFDHMFLLENNDTARLELPGLIMEGYMPAEELAKFDLTLIGTERGEELDMRFEYCTDLYTNETIERFAGYFKEIVTQVCSDPTIQLGGITMIGKQEQDLLLYRFNDTAFIYPEQQSVIQLFESVAHEDPGQVAVCDEKQSMTYGELNALADQLAGSIAQHAQPGTNGKIAFMFEPSANMVAVMLAILKTGNAYVSLTAEMPLERNQFIFRDCGASLLVIEQQLLLEHTYLGEMKQTGNVLVIDPLHPGAKVTFSSGVSANELIYMIYTSGTTGTPKGVEVRANGLLNTVHNYRHIFNLKKGSRMSQVASMSFDASAFEIWPALSFGATLYIAPEKARRDPDTMLNWLIQKKIAYTFQTPHIATRLLQDERFMSEGRVKVCTVAGDVFTYFPDKELPFKLYNLYGPTEDAVWTTFQELRYDNPIGYYSIGRPIGNKQLYITDTNQRLVPLGVAGELCIGGTGLAKGYINNEALTAEKFCELPTLPGKRIYRTGDLVRWKQDGNVEYLGRIDEQVKLRGYRIELREIEQLLCQYPGIQETVVSVTDNNGNPQLAAYYTGDTTFSSRELKAFMRKKLPAYMIPVFYTRLEQFPLSTSGKIDRKKIPAPVMEADLPFMAPASHIEKKLVDIWAAVLNRPATTIGITMNFFELGGNSMNILQLNSRVNVEFGCSISVTEMFMLSTIQEMQDYITDGKKDISLTAQQLEESVNEADENIRLMQNF